MGSTSNSLDKGGENFKKLYYAFRRYHKETATDRLAQDYIVCLYLWSGTTKDSLILMDIPVFDTPSKTQLKGLRWRSLQIEVGVINHWQNEVDGLKGDQDGLNEYYRQFPSTEQHAFRDEAKESLFNLTKIYEQIDYNEESDNSKLITKGNFQWQGGVKDTIVRFYTK